MTSIFQTRSIKSDLAAKLIIATAVSLFNRSAPADDPILERDKDGQKLVPKVDIGEEGAGTQKQARQVLMYSSMQPQNLEIFLYNKPGAEPERLTHHIALDYGAKMSPDGMWVVFTSERTGNPDLFALNLKTRELFQLTKDTGADDQVDIAPDGKTLAFVSTRSGNPDIHKMPFDPEGGTGEGFAVNLTNSRSNDWRPEFSPDGKQIAFSWESWGHDYDSSDPYERESGNSINVMNVDGTDLRHVIDGKAGSPEWSPDGKRLYFFLGVSDVPKNLGMIHSINLDGGAKPENLNWQTGPAYGVKIGRDGSVLVNGLEPHPTGKGVGVGSWRPRVMERRAGADSFSEMKGPGVDFAVSDIGPSGQVLSEAELPRKGVPVMSIHDRSVYIPGSIREVKLPDQTITVKGLGLFFPSIGGTERLLAGIDSFAAGRSYDFPIVIPPNLVVGNEDGTAMRVLVKGSLDHPMWGVMMSPDGKWIYFTRGKIAARSTMQDGKVDIFRIRTDGNGFENFTKGIEGNCKFPDISEDGSKIVFAKSTVRGSTICIMNSDGTGFREISNHDGYSTMPAISRAGDKIAYTAQTEQRKREEEDSVNLPFRIYVQSIIEADAKPRLLERHGNEGDSTNLDMHPRFSPDGKYIAFVSTRGGLVDEWVRGFRGPQPYGELYVVPIDGRTPAIRITHDKWEDGVPAWTTAP